LVSWRRATRWLAEIEEREMRSEAASVAEYLDALPTDRQAPIAAVRDLVLRHLPPGYVEAMHWGMIAYEVPMEVSGPTYNGQPLLYAALGNQKHYMALYLSGLKFVPGLDERFRAAWAASGKKLDLGKTCVRFCALDQLDTAAIAEILAAVPVEVFAAAAGRH